MGLMAVVTIRLQLPSNNRLSCGAQTSTAPDILINTPTTNSLKFTRAVVHSSNVGFGGNQYHKHAQCHKDRCIVCTNRGAHSTWPLGQHLHCSMLARQVGNTPPCTQAQSAATALWHLCKRQLSQCLAMVAWCIPGVGPYMLYTAHDHEQTIMQRSQCAPAVHAIWVTQGVCVGVTRT